MLEAGVTRYCAGCVGSVSAQGSCLNELCRWSDAAYPESANHLPRHYVLQGRYYVGRVLGQGGFGVTYMGRDLRLNRPVAIKEFLPSDRCLRSTDRATVHPCNEDGVDLFSYGLEQFLLEAQNLASLGGHRNVVLIMDHVEANSTAYMIMEYVQGTSLKQHVADRGGRISPEAASDIIFEVIAGLRNVHEQGLLHRDVSPDNIMIQPSGSIKLIDFGAARHYMRAASRGMSVILKHGYAPEEQYRMHGDQGPWTDVYATAATMYKCITGEVPPPSPDRQSGDAQLKRPSVACPSISPAMEAALLRGLAILAKDRFPSVDDFGLALAERRPVAVAKALPPSLHLPTLLALSTISAGLFPMLWTFAQSNWARGFAARSRAWIFFSLNAIASLSAFCIVFAVLIGGVSDSTAEWDQILALLTPVWPEIVSLLAIGAVFYFLGIFDVRRVIVNYSIEAEAPLIRPSGWMTLCFSIFYLQHHLNQVRKHMQIEGLRQPKLQEHK